MTETHTREWKRLWKDDYLKWICGFANAAGGVLEIGRDDDGYAIGVTDASTLLTEIPNKVQTTMGILVDVELTTEGGLDLVTVRVAPHTQPISYRGEYYYRSGTTNQKLTGPALSRFILEKMNISWDAVTTQRVSRTDLDAGAISAWRRRALRHDRVDASILRESDEDLLTSHESKPWNPRIARAFYRAGEIETWGRGGASSASLKRAAAPAFPSRKSQPVPKRSTWNSPFPRNTSPVLGRLPKKLGKKLVK